MDGEDDHPGLDAVEHAGIFEAFVAAEGVLDFTKGGYRKLNNGNGVGHTDVWVEPPSKQTAHPAERPTEMWRELMRLCSAEGETVLDIFGGSGSTMIAGEVLGRVTRLVELDPTYADVSLDRYAAFAHADPIHADSGKTWSGMKAERVAIPA